MTKSTFTLLIILVLSSKSLASGLEMPPAWELKEHCRAEFLYDDEDSEIESETSPSCLTMILSFVEGVKEMARQSGIELELCEETSDSFEKYFLSDSKDTDEKEFGEFIWGYIVGRCQK